MARKVTTVLIDDLTGENADETVEFGIDGKLYEIELTADNASRPSRTAGRLRQSRPPRRAPRINRPQDRQPEGFPLRPRGDPRMGPQQGLRRLRPRPHPRRHRRGLRQSPLTQQRFQQNFALSRNASAEGEIAIKPAPAWLWC